MSGSHLDSQGLSRNCPRRRKSALHVASTMITATIAISTTTKSAGSSRNAVRMHRSILRTDMGKIREALSTESQFANYSGNCGITGLRSRAFSRAEPLAASTRSFLKKSLRTSDLGLDLCPDFEPRRRPGVRPAATMAAEISSKVRVRRSVFGNAGPTRSTKSSTTRSGSTRSSHCCLTAISRVLRTAYCFSFNVTPPANA